MTILKDTAKCVPSLSQCGIATHEDVVMTGPCSALSHLLLCTAVKTALWSGLYYGQLPYLMTFAAAKTHLQFYIIERGSVAHPKAFGPIISLETMSGPAKALLAAVNLHRILRTVENYLRQETLPLDELQVSSDAQGYTREL